MHRCEKCGNWFRDSYVLKKHLSRKKPCVNVNFEVKNEVSQENTSNSPSAPSNKCDYCLHTFYNKWSRKQHEKICRHRNDTRLLEIEMGIEPNIPECNVECRFCNKTMFRTDKLKKHVIICKNRIDYHEKLLKQKEEKIQPSGDQTLVNNGTINNITNNNNIIVFNKPRSLEHIEVEQIIQFLRDLKGFHLPEQTYEKAGDLIVMMENYIQENELNRNFVIPDYKSVIGYVKNNENWTVTGIENPLNQQFKETAGIIYNKKEEIDNVNEKVFQNNNNVEIFKHVNQFNKKGFSYTSYGDQKTKIIKSNYKITKLKNKNICDF